jgi:hypothetical protein
VANDRFYELDLQLKNKSLESALVVAKAGHQTMQNEIEALDSERLQLATRIKAGHFSSARINLGEGDEPLNLLRKKAADLHVFIGDLDKVIQETTSEEAKTQRQMLERARLLEGQAEISEALRLYEKFLEMRPKEKKISDHVSQLKRSWSPKNENHALARQFIYQTFPSLDANGLKTNLEKTQKALAESKSAGDYFSAMKMRNLIVGHLGKMKSRLETLGRQDTPDNRNETRTILEVAEALAQLHNDINIFLKKK